MYAIKRYTGFLVVIFLVVCVSAFGWVGTARAVEFVDGDTIPAGEVIDDDVFIAGENVTIDGTVNGDLWAAGSTVTINGIINGSLFSGGQTVIINGEVAGSVYAGASAVEMGAQARILRNAYVGGFALTTRPGSLIGRDLLVGGYQADLQGEVAQDFLGGLGALEIDGKVGGDVNVEVGRPGDNFGMMPFFSPPGAPPMLDPGIRISDQAEIGGQLVYVSPVDQSSAIGSQPEGGVVLQTPVPAETSPASPQGRVALDIGRWILERLRELFTLLVLGGLAAWLIPALMNRWSERVRSEPLPAAGWGLIVAILGYIGAGLLAVLILGVGLLLSAITLGGLSRTVFGLGFSGLSLVFTVFQFLVSYGSKLVVAYLVGKLLLEKLAPQAAGHRFWPLLLGIVIYIFFRSIPLVGWLVGLIVTCVGLGAIWLGYYKERQVSLPAVTA